MILPSIWKNLEVLQMLRLLDKSIRKANPHLYVLHLSIARSSISLESPRSL